MSDGPSLHPSAILREYRHLADERVALTTEGGLLVERGQCGIDLLPAGSQQIPKFGLRHVERQGMGVQRLRMIFVEASQEMSRHANFDRQQGDILT